MLTISLSISYPQYSMFPLIILSTTSNSTSHSHPHKIHPIHDTSQYPCQSIQIPMYIHSHTVQQYHQPGYYIVSQILYMKIIVFERHPIAYFVWKYFSKIIYIYIYIYIYRVRRISKIPTNVILNVIVRLSVITCRPLALCCLFFSYHFLVVFPSSIITIICSYNDMIHNDKLISFLLYNIFTSLSYSYYYPFPIYIPVS